MFKLNSVQIESIRRNYDGGELSCDQLIELLESRVAPGAQPARTLFLRELVVGRHRNLRAHTEGSKDGTLHYTVFVGGRGYHLRVDRRGVVFQITNKEGDLHPVPPWVRPGGAPSRSAAGKKKR
ncbi:MAG: hypothetical protein R3B81_04915 [bacterium]